MNNAQIASLEIQQRSLWRDALRRMLRSPLTVVGILIVVTMVLIAVFAAVIAPYHPIKGDVATLYTTPPSAEHPFGTDDIGRDVLSRTIYGAQISLRIAILSQLFGLTLGTLVGMVAGYYAGWIDALVMRVVDGFMAFPFLIIALALIVAVGASEESLILALSIAIWPSAARLVRSQVLSARESEYVAAARVVGTNDLGIMFRHILPNILTPLVVVGTLGIANVVLQEAALSFLGLGNSDRTVPSWGRMIADGRTFIRSAWWMTFFPGLAMMLTVLGFNLFGDGLRDALDVRSE